MTLEDIPTHALSIMQPWAWGIIYGGKDVENRDWKSWNAGLKFRGPVLIHAGKRKIPEDVHHFLGIYRPQREKNPALPAPLVYGAYAAMQGGIVGMAEVVDAVHENAASQLGALWPLSSPWFFGPWGLGLRNARPLPFIACRGRLGFYKVDDWIREKLAEAA